MWVKVSTRYRGKTEGLCGTYNGNSSDDFRKHNKKITSDVNEFGAHWQTDEHCPHPKYVFNPCNGVGRNVLNEARRECGKMKNNKPFKQCNKRVSPGMAIRNCEYDYCGCDSKHLKTCLCEAYEAYAMRCGIHENAWRQPDAFSRCSKYTLHFQLYLT